MGCKGLLHVIGARLERPEQVAMAALKILQHVRQLSGRRLGIERQNPVDDMVGTCLVSVIEIAGFDGRLERAYHHPRRVGAQMQGLPIQKHGL